MTPDESIHYWRQTAEPVLTRAGFEEARRQQQEFSVAYRVRLVAAVNGDFGPWARAVADFLESYGIDVVSGEATPHELLALSPDEADLFVVWPTSNDLQSFCTAFAEKSFGARRLLVCIPEGDDGLFYSRHLREEHSVDTIAFPANRLLKGEKSRLGLDLLLRCAALMMAKCAACQREERLRNTYVVLIHGIRTRALWEGVVRATLQEAGLVAWPTNYNKFDVCRFLLPFERLKKTAVERVEKDIKVVTGNVGNVEMAVLAHSFGSYITGRLVNKGHAFKRVALCGSVLRTDFDFSKTNEMTVVNEAGRSDIWPVLAEKLGWGAYGATGTFGFNRKSVIDRVHPKFYHSSSLTAEFCKRFWTPFFCDGHVEDSGYVDSPASFAVRVLDRWPFLGLLFWLLLSVLVVVLAVSVFRFAMSVI
jgi:hypothetical protein